MATYLITGGAGFIGTNLCEQLVHDNHHVIVVDDLSAGTDPKRLPQEVVFHKLDVCDTEALVPLLAGVDVVVHLVARPSIPYSIDHPFHAQHVNIDGTLSVMEAVRTAGVKRVVYAASASAYGNQDTMPLTETMPAQPNSPYGLHKYYGEHLMKIWNLIHGIETVSLRFFNTYGPYLDPTGAYALVIGRFLKQRSEGLPMTITGDGEQTRDLVHVRDLARAVILASQSSAVGKGEVMNVGTGESVTINEVARLIGGPVEYIPPRIEARHTLADSTIIRETLGWTPTVSLEDGILELKRIFGLV
jgi:UDP-glucose 4-epimerase